MLMFFCVIIDYRDILDSISPDLNDVNMEILLPYLQSHHLVTQDDQYHLSSAMYSPHKKSQMLLNCLKHNGNHNLHKFLCCLNLAHEHSGHKGIADKLKQKLKVNDVDCHDVCSDDCRKRSVA